MNQEEQVQEEQVMEEIVVLDGYTENPGDLSWDGIAEFGTLRVFDRTSVTDEAEIIEHIGNAGIVLTNKTPISRNVIEACKNIKFIGLLATGYNVVDYKFAADKGIPVANVPSYGTASVSQYSIALLLEICHHIGHHDASVHAGNWEKCIDWCYWDYPLIELEGKTMGIIGFGRIGQAEGRIAKALGMRVLAYDCYPNAAGEEIADYVDLETLYKQSDVITLHCNLTPENTGMINQSAIAKMKDGVILINNARGQLIAEQDVADALNRGKIAGAGLDVVYTEPIRGDNPLLKAKNCIITPHISWAPRESRQRIMDCTIENIKSFIAGKPVHVVN
jgi:glycerate dehydrogenase